MNTLTLAQMRAMIPGFVCKPGCTDCCGPVPWTLEEWEAVPNKRKPLGKGLHCPYAGPTGCQCYEHRPMMCRLFGTVQSMACPHGCKPPVWLPEADERAIMDSYTAQMPKGEVARLLGTALQAIKDGKL